MKKRLLLALFAGCFTVQSLSFAIDAAPAATPVPYVPDPTFPKQPTPPVLSPQEELKTFHLPPGYHLELVLSEPLVREPVTCTFDGNGRMYVAEMRTYMQDADRKDELTPPQPRVPAREHQGRRRFRQAHGVSR